MPALFDILSAIRDGDRIFLDASQASLSIALNEESMDIMAIIRPHGLYEFTWTSFGLLNMVARYNRDLRDLEEQAGEGSRFYVYDTLAISKTF